MPQEKYQQKFARADGPPTTGLNWAADGRQSSTANVGGFFYQTREPSRLEVAAALVNGACTMAVPIALVLMLVRFNLQLEPVGLPPFFT